MGFEQAHLRLDKMSLAMASEVPISLKVPEEGPEIREDDFYPRMVRRALLPI